MLQKKVSLNSKAEEQRSRQKKTEPKARAGNNTLFMILKIAIHFLLLQIDKKLFLF